jgi:hypothetical protein
MALRTLTKHRDNFIFIMWSFTVWLNIFWFTYQSTFCECCIMNLVLSFRCFQCWICIEFSHETGNQLRSKNNFVNGNQRICKPCLLKTVQYCTLLVTFYTCYKYPVDCFDGGSFSNVVQNWHWAVSHISENADLHAVLEVMATRGMAVLEWPV